ncbi:hypothetical protein ABW19_dt0207894 [Dactylella cylindrospora]|nr:hypothetical protein ABW19_dt0207894 [Dactylella cylindrospora]
MTTKINTNLLQDSDSDDDFSTLPFPQPLPRSAFTTPDFSASEYLSTLHRHQTLEDLRNELRTRSKDLERELVELVNRDYADFVGLGSSLRGGEGKVNDLKLGVMGFAREVEGVKAKVVKVADEVEREMGVKKEVGKKKALARNLINIETRLSQLEALLHLREQDETTAILLYDPSVDDSSTSLTSLPRLQKLVASYLYLQHVLNKVPSTHPFIVAQQGRIKKATQTISDDLARALKECRNELKDEENTEEEKKEHERKLVEVLKLWSDIGGAEEAVKTLKERRR